MRGFVYLDSEVPCPVPGVEIFVDDSFDNFVELNKAGIFTYLYTAPWNIKHDVGHMRIDSLNDLPLLTH